ncbi:MAG: hypothetical protein WD316_12100 [Phycisphaeraceae bacterium]
MAARWAPAAALLAGAVVGADADQVVHWTGINAAETVAANVGDALNWHTGQVPGPGDTAVFHWAGVGSAYRGDVHIGGDGGGGGGGFAPSHIVHDSFGFSSWGGDLRFVADFQLSSLAIATGWTDSARGRVSVGPSTADAPDTPVTLTLTGERALSFAGHQGGWAALELAPGATLAFAGEQHVFDAFNPGYWHDRDGLHPGFNAMRGDGVVAFTHAGGTITLGHPGTHFYSHDPQTIEPLGYASVRYLGPLTPAAISLGANALRLRSDQTWVSEAGTGVIRLQARAGAPVVHAIDGQPLDNLGQVALEVDHTGTHGDTATIPHVTLQALTLRGRAGAAGRNDLLLVGDVQLTGGAVRPGHPASDDGAIDAQQATPGKFSLVLNYEGQAGGQLLVDGRSFTADRGVRIEHRGTDPAHDAAVAFIRAEGATLNIAGDLVYHDAGAPAGHAVFDIAAGGDVLREGRRVGIHGDAETVINLGGSFTTNARSPAQLGDGLHASTLNMLGGTPGAPVSIEAAAHVDDAIAPATYALGRLRIGAPDGAAHVMIVNDWINDGRVAINAAGDASRTSDDEVLITNHLAIAAGSVLDLNGQTAVVHGSLAIDPAGTLDLNTGSLLDTGDIVAGFIGVGDQVSAWTALADRVVDSFNPGASFAATYDAGRTYWRVGAASAMLLGDMNLDGSVDAVDVAPFVLALTNPGAYEGQHGIDPVLVGDINEDGAFDAVDVAPFVHLLVTGTPVPEPAATTLLTLAGAMLVGRRRRGASASGAIATAPARGAVPARACRACRPVRPRRRPAAA